MECRCTPTRLGSQCIAARQFLNDLLAVARESNEAMNKYMQRNQPANENSIANYQTNRINVVIKTRNIELSIIYASANVCSAASFESLLARPHSNKCSNTPRHDIRK